MRPRLLDLFCGAGGCSVGYHKAGFDVVGVDVKLQPDYPFEFHLADAMTYSLDRFDAVHASPPCQRFTVANRVAGSSKNHLDLLTPTLTRLRRSGLVWVVENVPGSPMPDDAVVLCGSMFDLKVRRHRLFASSEPLTGSGCNHKRQGRALGVYGNGGAWTRKQAGGGGTKVVRKEAADAMGVYWTEKQPALAQMIPPAYTHFIGEQIRSCFDA